MIVIAPRKILHILRVRNIVAGVLCDSRKLGRLFLRGTKSLLASTALDQHDMFVVWLLLYVYVPYHRL